MDEPLSVAEALELRRGLAELHVLDARFAIEEHDLLAAGATDEGRLACIRQLRSDIALTLAAACTMENAHTSAHSIPGRTSKRPVEAARPLERVAQPVEAVARSENEKQAEQER